MLPPERARLPAGPGAFLQAYGRVPPAAAIPRTRRVRLCFSQLKGDEMKPGRLELGLIATEVMVLAGLQWHSVPVGIGAAIASFLVVQLLDRKTAYLIAICLGLGWYRIAVDLGGLSWGIAVGVLGVILNIGSMQALRSEGAYAPSPGQQERL